jgi:hypothetical protein
MTLIIERPNDCAIALTALLEMARHENGELKIKSSEGWGIKVSSDRKLEAAIGIEPMNKGCADG